MIYKTLSSAHLHPRQFDPCQEFFWPNGSTPSDNGGDSALGEHLTSGGRGFMSSGKEPFFFFDLDNTLYPQSSGIASMVGQRIRSFCSEVHGMSEQEATFLASKYHTDYGLAIKGLLKHHDDVDPVAYDAFVDGGVPIEKILSKDGPLKSLLSNINEVFCTSPKWVFTNAGKIHAQRVLSVLGLEDGIFDGVIYCDYSGKEFICKPQVEAFYAAAIVANVSPHFHECVLIDDSVANVQSAIKAGWSAILVQEEIEENLHQRSHIVNTNSIDYPIIKNIHQLSELLYSRGERAPSNAETASPMSSSTQHNYDTSPPMPPLRINSNFLK